MRCRGCGKENEEGSEVCLDCGQRMDEDPASEADKTIIYSPAEVEIEKKTEKILVPIDQMKEDTPALLILKGPSEGEKFVLDKQEITLGRHPESDIFLNDITVSRNHARISKSGVEFVLEDAGSLNGTYLNRKQIDRCALKDQDEIQIGKFKLMFLAAKKE